MDKSLLIERIKTKLKVMDSVSINEELRNYREETQESNPNYELKITGNLAEDISRAIIKDKRYDRTAKGHDYFISKKLEFKPLNEKYPIAYAVFIAIIGAGLSLATGYTLWRIDNRSKRQEMQGLQEELVRVNLRIDSIKNLPIYQASKKQDKDSLP